MWSIVQVIIHIKFKLHIKLSEESMRAHEDLVTEYNVMNFVIEKNANLEQFTVYIHLLKSLTPDLPARNLSSVEEPNV